MHFLALVHVVQARRRQKIGVINKKRIIQVVGAHHADCAQAWQRNFFVGPSGNTEGVLVKLAAHVVHRGDQQVVERRRNTAERHPVFGTEQHFEVATAIHEGVQVDGQQAVLGISLATNGPVGTQRDQHLFLEDALHVGVFRDVHHFEFSVAHQRHRAAEKFGRLVGQVVTTLGRVHAVDTGRDVGHFAFKNQLGGRQVSAALPFFGLPRVARIGQRAFTKIGADPNRILIFPADRGLGFGQDKTVGNKFLFAGVKFAGHHGIATTAGQRNQEQIVVGVQSAGALPDPVLILGRGQGVHVDHRFPDRSLAQVLLERGAAPDAAHVVGILPEIVVPVAVHSGVGDAVAGIVNLQQLFVDGRELGHRFELGCVLAAALGDPLEGLLAVDFFQPEIGVGFFGNTGSRGQQQQNQQQGICEAHRVSLARGRA